MKIVEGVQAAEAIPTRVIKMERTATTRTGTLRIATAPSQYSKLNFRVFVFVNFGPEVFDFWPFFICFCFSKSS